MSKFFNKEIRKELHLLARASAIGVSMVIAIMLGFSGGYFLDSYWISLHPWGKIIGLVLGIIASYRNIFIIIKRNRFNLDI